VTDASSVSDAGSAERARLLADDHPALAGEYSIVGSVRDGYELVAEAKRLHPHVPGWTTAGPCALPTANPGVRSVPGSVSGGCPRSWRARPSLHPRQCDLM